jgi:hypothetical protein
VAECVDAAVELMEAAGLDTVVDGGAAQAQRQQLVQGKQAVLSPCESGDPAFSVER